MLKDRLATRCLAIVSVAIAGTLTTATVAAQEAGPRVLVIAQGRRSIASNRYLESHLRIALAALVPLPKLWVIGNDDVDNVFESVDTDSLSDNDLRQLANLLRADWLVAVAPHWPPEGVRVDARLISFDTTKVATEIASFVAGSLDLAIVEVSRLLARDPGLQRRRLPPPRRASPAHKPNQRWSSRGVAEGGLRPHYRIPGAQLNASQHAGGDA